MGTLDYLRGRDVSQITEDNSNPPKETIVPLGEFVGDANGYIFYLDENDELKFLETFGMRVVFSRP